MFVSVYSHVKKFIFFVSSTLSYHLWKQSAFYAFFSNEFRSHKPILLLQLKLEKQREGVSAILHPEQLHQQAEHYNQHTEPKVDPDTLLDRRCLSRDEDRERDDGECKETVCITKVYQQ